VTSYEGLVDDKVALDQLLFFGMVDEFASGEARRLVCFCPLATATATLSASSATLT